MKAAEKDRIIRQHCASLNLLQRPHLATCRANKVLRHAKRRAKLGLLDKQVVDSIVAENGAVGESVVPQESYRDRSSFSHSDTVAHAQKTVLPTLRPPSDLANAEDLLRALCILGGMFPSGSSCESSTLGSEITALLDQGRTAWSMYAFSQARMHFDRAGVLSMQILKQGKLPALAILRCLVLRKRLRCPEYETFARFILSALREVLGDQHLFVMAAQMMKKLPFHEGNQTAVWDSIRDSFALTPDNYEQWCMLACRYSRSLHASG